MNLTGIQIRDENARLILSVLQYEEMKDELGKISETSLERLIVENLFTR